MSDTKVVVPDIGYVESVDVIEVLVSPGSEVTKEQGLIVIESDKASMEVPSPAAGKIKEVSVKVGDKDVKCKVKAGTQDGTLLRVKGKGAPKLKGSGRGDVLARVKVTVPKRLKKRERELLEELQKQPHDDPRDALFT